jgi:hypothetical protein
MSAVWTDIVMDFVEGFPKIGSKSMVLTIVYRFSRWCISSPSGTHTQC